jgi:hypothetical protein
LEEVINLDALVKHGSFSPEDLDLFHHSDSVDDAFDFITAELTAHPEVARGGSL